MKCCWFYHYFAIVIFSFWYFLKTRFSATAPIRHQGSTRTETVGLCNPGPCLGDAWIISTLCTLRIYVIPKSAPAAGGSWHTLSFQPPCQKSSHQTQRCWAETGNAEVGSALTLAGANREREGTGASSPLGWLVPRRSWDTSTSFRESWRWPSPWFPWGHAVPWAGHGPSTVWGGGFPWGFHC